MTYSRHYKLNGRTFRYNYDEAVVEAIFKEDGHWEVLDSIGLSRKAWADKELREEYLQEYSDELDEEVSYLVNDFIENELPYYL